MTRPINFTNLNIYKKKKITYTQTKRINYRVNYEKHDIGMLISHGPLRNAVASGTPVARPKLEKASICSPSPNHGRNKCLSAGICRATINHGRAQGGMPRCFCSPFWTNAHRDVRRIAISHFCHRQINLLTIFKTVKTHLYIHFCTTKKRESYKT